MNKLSKAAGEETGIFGVTGGHKGKGVQDGGGDIIWKM